MPIIYPKCKDYAIFKIRYYADEKLLKKVGPRDPYPEQHRERAELHNRLYWTLFEHVTGKKERDFRLEYPFSSLECALEEIEEVVGVHIIKREGDEIFLIPKINNELWAWFMSQIKTPFKVLQKTRLGYIFVNDSVNTYWRNKSRQFREDNKDFYDKLYSHDN